MKILFVNTYYYPNMFGGAEHSVKILAEGLSEEHECAVFSVDSGCNEGLKSEKIGNVCVFRSGSRCFDFAARFHKTESLRIKLKNRLADLYNPAALKHFKTVIQQFKPDVILTNGLRGIGPQVWKIANQNGVKVVHTLRDYFVVDPTMKMNHLSFFWLWKSFFSHYSKFINYLTAPSDYTIDKVIAAGFYSPKKKKVAIPNGTDVDRSLLCKLIDAKRTQNSPLTQFIFVGTLGLYKGIMQLIEAFNQLRDKNVRLVICGSGTLKNEVLNAVAKNPNIVYRGQLPSDVLKEEYRKSDVCVIPSLWDEPFGRVVVEAAANGCAVIASNRGGIPEIVKNLGVDEPIDCYDLHQLNLSLEQFCSLEKRLEQLDCILKNITLYSKENNVKSYEKVFFELVSAH